MRRSSGGLGLLFVVCCVLFVVSFVLRHSLSFVVCLFVCLFVCLGAGCCGLFFVSFSLVVVVVICFVAAAVLKMHDSQATTFGSRCFNK